MSSRDIDPVVAVGGGGTGLAKGLSAIRVLQERIINESLVQLRSCWRSGGLYGIFGLTVDGRFRQEKEPLRPNADS